ncbi:GNAT family N-acetyltransferase [Georgenia sp. Z1344]|uniref:GNAT family N-acetyltransferase n=1 Tax=Georgenia sp. Z1344 TaxID=3416706 RepID=UPI003CECB982
MPDPIFDDARLAPIYDPFDPDRSDLDAYVDLVAEAGAARVLDLGCGTGTLAIRLAAAGTEVVGIDPAAASVDVARGKPGADAVRWVVGTAADAPAGWADLAVMTANVAQVFLTDEDWSATLRHLRRSLAPGGLLAFETRRPEARAWEDWGRRYAPETIDVPGTGEVTQEYTLLAVDLPLVSFRFTHTFHSDGAVVVSDSTLRFRDRAEVTADLLAAGFAVEEVRDAPDRPGREHVFLARRRPWTVRPAGADDETHLWRGLARATAWRGGEERPVEVLRADGDVARYVEGWTPDQGGVVAVGGDGEVLGVAWLRLLPADGPGYGFVAEDVPELSIGVAPSARGAGVGSALLAVLLERARRDGRRAVSLSVERDNVGARRLYDRAGFVRVGAVGGADTLLCEL